MAMAIKSKNIIIPVLVFFVAWIVSFTLQTRAPEFATMDDPYYHAYRSHILLTGESPDLPIYSVLRHENVNFYLGYHMLGALFIAPFETSPDDHAGTILGFKLYHGFL